MAKKNVGFPEASEARFGGSKKKLTVTLHIGGKQVEKLTDEQCGKMAEKLSETMSRYYSANPGELKQMKK